MAKGQWIKFSQGQNFKYYKGNIVYQATYDGKVLRYNLFKISKSHYNEKTIALLRDDENYNVEECVRLIDEKAKEVHKAFGYIVTRLPKGKSITKKDIDNYLVLRTDCPTVNVQDGLMLGQISNVDAIVAVGGGSVIDTAKAISIIMTNPEHSGVTSLAGAVETRNKGLPCIVVENT